MRKHRKIVAIAAMVGLMALAAGGGQGTAPAAAQGGTTSNPSFLKLEGIEGESTDAKHKGEIEIESWSWGETNSSGGGGGGGAGAGKVNIQDFHFTTKYSKASPKLFLACASGEHIPSAVLTLRKAGGGQQEYLVVTLKDVFVTSYQTGGSGSDVPTDQISLSFNEITFEYSTQRVDGSLGDKTRASWNIKENKGT